MPPLTIPYEVGFTLSVTQLPYEIRFELSFVAPHLDLAGLPLILAAYQGRHSGSSCLLESVRAQGEEHGSMSTKVPPLKEPKYRTREKKERTPKSRQEDE